MQGIIYSFEKILENSVLFSESVLLYLEACYTIYRNPKIDYITYLEHLNFGHFLDLQTEIKERNSKFLRLDS